MEVWNLNWKKRVEQTHRSRCEQKQPVSAEGPVTEQEKGVRVASGALSAIQIRFRAQSQCLSTKLFYGGKIIHNIQFG